MSEIKITRQYNFYTNEPHNIFKFQNCKCIIITKSGEHRLGVVPHSIHPDWSYANGGMIESDEVVEFAPLIF